MGVFRRALALVAFSPALLVATSLVPLGRADGPGQCHVVDIDFTPGGLPAGTQGPSIDPQIVMWLEKPNGEYVATIYITQQTGLYGIGNRPGRFDFNSGPHWPYGRRTTVFPVWAHRHGIMFPEVDFQNTDDSNLSHPFNESSPEGHYCRPLQRTEPSWDAGSCASAIYTDKGVFSGSRMSLYPPRADVNRVPVNDSPSVDMYKMLNQFDAVSGATPHMGTAATVSWPIPQDLPQGDYVLWTEVSLEMDFNATYNAQTLPPPTGIPWADYGVPYRGQPSVVYKVPFTISNVEAIAKTDDYVGYGDPNGADGTLHAPDATITTGMPNTGASRILMSSKNGETYRIRVDARPEFDFVPPGTPQGMGLASVDARSATLTFVAPGDDGTVGKVKGYEVRFLVGDTPIDDSNFDSANMVAFNGTIVDPGELQTLVLQNLLPETDYTVGVRAFDDCHNTSPITTTTFTTAQRPVGEVDACFVATAAYGSLLANDVELLRHFRDAILKKSVFGELFIESYYTFGPPVAGVVGESDLLRETARDVLNPIVKRVKSLRF